MALKNLLSWLITSKTTLAKQTNEKKEPSFLSKLKSLCGKLWGLFPENDQKNNFDTSFILIDRPINSGYSKNDKEWFEKKKWGIEKIILEDTIAKDYKIFLLREAHGYTNEEAKELIKTAKMIVHKEKLRETKREIIQKVRARYGNIQSDDRQPIPENVQNQVWNRDGGKCVKCGSQEKLEFDHIIPVSKGGANTARNLQLLCEKCNRAKSNNIG